MAKTIVQTILDIDKKVCTLSSEEKNFIKETLLEYGNNKQLAAEIISVDLNVDESAIFELL